MCRNHRQMEQALRRAALGVLVLLSCVGCVQGLALPLQSTPLPSPCIRNCAALPSPCINMCAAPAEPRRQRRVRYSGKYPKKFEEKHKEHAGDAAVMERVKLKGGTPAGSHVPIMVDECLAHMGLAAGETEIVSAVPSGSDGLTVVDCTLGFGGHSGRILSALAERTRQPVGASVVTSTLVAFDQDAVEMAKTEARLRARDDVSTSSTGEGVRLRCINANFGTIAASMADAAVPMADGLLADLGCSSMQIDDPSRGFTWKADGPLDMRMDVTAQAVQLGGAGTVTGAASHASTHPPSEAAGSALSGGGAETAAELLARSNVTSLAAILRANSDFDKADARAVALACLAAPAPTTTRELDARVRSVPIPPDADDGALAARGRGGGRAGGRGGGRGGRGGGRGGGGQEKRKASSGPSDLDKALNSRVARVMQALRIEVNHEFAALDALLAALPSVLAPGGRAVVLTFHSGEDRRVKQAMKAGLKEGVYSEVARRPVRPSHDEARANPRSKCCKLRWCVRSA